MKPMPDEESRSALEDAIRIIGEEYRDVIYSTWRLGRTDGRISLRLERLKDKENELQRLKEKENELHTTG